MKPQSPNTAYHTQHRPLASYGRRRGRKLRPGKKDLLEHLLPEITVKLSPDYEVDPTELFPGRTMYWLEIGFGAGEHLAHQASMYPQVGIIGCEPYMDGVAGLLTQIRDHNLNNIRIHNEDARLLMPRLPDRCLSRVFVLYPDPWPKVRHHKRRLISTGFLDELARIMHPDAELRLATDDEEYCSWMLAHLLGHPAFLWKVKDSADWQNPPPDWISTRYEQKAIKAGRVPTYLTFIRTLGRRN